MAARQRRPDVRRHATWPQSWIQRENWEFETHTISSSNGSSSRAASSSNWRLGSCIRTFSDALYDLTLREAPLSSATVPAGHRGAPRPYVVHIGLTPHSWGGFSRENWEFETHRRWAWLARHDDREYRVYLREEQRRQPGCSVRRMQADFHHGLLVYPDQRRPISYKPEPGIRRLSRLGAGPHTYLTSWLDNNTGSP